MRIISFPGRIVISRIEDFKEKDVDNKSIEDLIIENIKKNCHVEAQRDKKIMASGIITNLSQQLTEGFDNNVPKVRDFMGDPIHAFNHIYVNDDRKKPNNVFYIMSGLSPINDKINLITDRIEEIEERQRIMESEDALSSVELSSLTDKIADKTTITALKIKKIVAGCGNALPTFSTRSRRVNFFFFTFSLIEYLLDFNPFPIIWVR